MKANIGNRVVKRGLDTDVFDLIIVTRTENTIGTNFVMPDGNPSASVCDRRMNPSRFRVYDEIKVKRLDELHTHIEELKAEFREVFGSLETIS